MMFPTLSPRAGIGLKPQHYTQVLQSVSASRPANASPGWLEVHPQNYFCAGGPSHRWLEAIADQFALSFHSVGLSLGSSDGLFKDELEQLAALCDRYSPALVSDHLSWSGSASNRVPDLLPVPYTASALSHFCAQISRVQDRLRRTILIENPSRYLAFAQDEMDEVTFLHEVCRQTGCHILLDINNIEVSSTNLGFDAYDYLARLDHRLVGEVHLAGHSVEHHSSGPLLIDDHGSPVSEVTWALFAAFCRASGPKPVLVEWDNDVPTFEELLAEAQKADAVMLQASVEAEVTRVREVA